LDGAGLNRITLPECRRAYASLLMAAGHTINELMEYMGHADLQMVNRHVKLLPQPGEDDAADRLNA
jgi:integrase